MPPSDQDSKVSVEDLLRLKRAERPNPEFWANFERELRQKQLTALVKKRRWWHELPVLLNRRVYLPAGAAAMVAFALVTVRHTVPTQLAQQVSIAPEITAADVAIEMLAATEVTGPELVQTQSNPLQETTQITRTPLATIPVDEDLVVLSPAMSMLRITAAPASSAKFATLSRLESSDSALEGTDLASDWTAPAQAKPASVVQSEVAALTNAAASKYRLIARYVDRSLSPAPAAPALVRERLARRLGDVLEDDISRIGVKGGGVSLKF